MAPCRRRRRVRVDIDQAPIDLAIGRATMDRGDRFLERPVVEDRAVEKGGGRRIDIGAQVIGKFVGDELGAPRPVALPLRHHLVHFHDPRRRKGAGERRGRARGEGETGRIVQIELALDLAVRPPPIGEVQDVVVIELMNERRIVDLHQLLIAVIVGQRDEQVERQAGGQQRGLRVLGGAHARHGVIHQAGHGAPVERRLEPARTHEQRQLLAHLQVPDRAKALGLGSDPDERLQEPLAPGAGARVGRQQDRDIGIVEPQLAQRSHRQVMAQGTGQHGAVDAARRRAGDDIDDHAQFDVAADVAQQLEIDILGVVFGIGSIGAHRRTTPARAGTGRRSHGARSRHAPA